MADPQTAGNTAGGHRTAPLLRADEVAFRNAEGEVDFKPAAIAVTDMVRLQETIFAEDFRLLQGIAVDGVTPKLEGT